MEYRKLFVIVIVIIIIFKSYKNYNIHTVFPCSCKYCFRSEENTI